MNIENKILEHIGLYSEDGPKIWFTHRTNKKTYLLNSNLHPANAAWNGRGKDGVVGTHYDNDGNRLNRSIFIELDKIDQIWREPDPSYQPPSEVHDYDLNENEYPIS